MPVFVSPAGVHALCSPDGECATARACATAGILMGVSQHSTRSIEDVAAASTGVCPHSSVAAVSSTTIGSPNPLFYQAYILKDRMRTLSLIHRAIRAGYRGIFLTVDSVRFGYREADARNGFNALPPPHRLVNYDDVYLKCEDIHRKADNNLVRSSLHETYNSQTSKAWDQNSEQLFEQDVSWEDVSWIKDEIRTMFISIHGDSHGNLNRIPPLVVKGIMTGEDAILAINAGADGVMVSNHGGRQLDGCLATIDVLPEVVEAVQGRVPIWIDGGFRRGTDILKALGKF
jgi:(S)-2-hydroxy-acid oxidase